MTMVGCFSPDNFNHFYGGVEDRCKEGGSWYLETCGPNDAFTIGMPDELWRDTFPRHRNYSSTEVTDWAAYFMPRSRESGGQGSATGVAFEEMAMAWFGRNLALPEEDQAGKFYRTACTKMRQYNGLVGGGDGGPAYLDSREGSLHYEVSRML